MTYEAQRRGDRQVSDGRTAGIRSLDTMRRLVFFLPCHHKLREGLGVKLVLAGSLNHPVIG